MSFFKQLFLSFLCLKAYGSYINEPKIDQKLITSDDKEFYVYDINQSHDDVLHCLLKDTNPHIRKQVFDRVILKAREDYKRNSDSKILRYLRHAMHSESDYALAFILNIREEEAEYIRQKPSCDFSWSQDYYPYLHYYQTTTEELIHAQHYDCEDYSLTTNRVTLLNVIGLVYFIPFKIFIKNTHDPCRIDMCHQFNFSPEEHNLSYVHLLYDNRRYMLLLQNMEDCFILHNDKEIFLSPGPKLSNRKRILEEKSEPPLKIKRQNRSPKSSFREPNDEDFSFSAMSNSNFLSSGDKIESQVKGLISKYNTAYKNQENPYYAHNFLTEAYELVKKFKREDLYACLYIKLGNTYYQDGIHDQKDWYLKALHYLKEYPDHFLEIEALVGLGNVRYTDKTHPTNILWYKKALDSLDNHDHSILRAQALIGLGHAHYTDETHPQKSLWYIEALHTLKPTDNPMIRAQAMIGLGRAHYTDKDHPSYAEWIKEALKLLTPADYILRAQAMITLGQIHYQTDKNKFHHWFLEALNILKFHNHPELKAQAMIGLGNARYTNRTHKQDTEWYLDALDILGDNGPCDLKAQAMIGLGNARYTNRTHEKDTEWYLDALNVLGDNGPCDLKARAMIGLGNGQYDKPYHGSWFKKAFDLIKNTDKPRLKVQALMGLGKTNRNKNSRIRYLSDALTILDKYDDHNGLMLRAEIFLELGWAHSSAKSIEWFLKVLDICKKDTSTHPQVKINLKVKALIGLGYADRGHDSRQGTNWFLKALNLLEQGNNITLRTRALIGLGNVTSSKGKNDEALCYYNEALDIAPSQRLRNKAKRGIEQASFFLEQRFKKR